MLTAISWQKGRDEMREKRKTAIYLRISMEDAYFRNEYQGRKESSSISSQRMRLLEYIRNDSRLADKEVLEFCDDGYTGTNMERPGMQKLLKNVRENKIGCILVKDMSRFSRDYIETGTYLNQIFPFMGVDFIAVNDGYDSREQNGNAIALDTAFQTLLYDLYSKDISVKIKASLKNKCAQGEYVFGQVPLGYAKSRTVKNEVVVNEREAGIVRWIFSMAADGMSSTQIAKRLFEEKVPTTSQLRYETRKPELKEHHTWSGQMVRKILNNRFYLGEMAYGKSVRKSVGSRTMIELPKRDWKVVENHHEALVTPEVFDLAACRVPGQCTKRKRERHPLTGKIYCGGCGYSLNYKPASEGRKSGRFWCRKHALLQIPECCTNFNDEVLKETVLMLLNRELMKRGDVFRQRESLEQFEKKALDECEKKVRMYEKQSLDIQKAKDSLYERYAEREMDAGEYRKKADELEEERKELKGRLQETEEEYSRIAERAGREQWDMKQILRYSHMEELTQEVVDVFIKRVVAYKDKRVEIEWNFAESSSALRK